MTRLHEHQAKALLTESGIAVPEGGTASTPEQARLLTRKIGKNVFLKAQVWVTGRAGLGGIKLAHDPSEAERIAAAMLGRTIQRFPITEILVEEELTIAREFYAGIIVDDRSRTPLVIFASRGGTGIEELAREDPEHLAQHRIDVLRGLRAFEARDVVRRTGVHGRLLLELSDILTKLYRLARSRDARAVEINPLVLTTGGSLMAADCRMTIDDNAVFRQDDLGITLAREFDHPPTRLERIAWEVEREDFRGTFYFVQLEQDFAKGERRIAFHGSGGGGSMLGMDAALEKGLKVANFVDTSGNPAASKVYRAARIILDQSGIDGYFACGSGVASQEQFHSARGLAKAFLEAPLTVPAVIRLGGNGEEQAIAILERLGEYLSTPIEAYGKDDTPEFCAARLRELIASSPAANDRPPARTPPPAREPYSFRTISGGKVTLDHALCRHCESKICITTCVPEILTLENGVPVLNIDREEAARGGCSECVACDVECYFLGNRGGHLLLPIAGLEETIQPGGRE